jgi:hypothetical protein
MLLSGRGSQQTSPALLDLFYPMISSYHLLKEPFYCGIITLGAEHEFDCVSFFVQSAIEIFPLFAHFDVGAFAC